MKLVDTLNRTMKLALDDGRVSSYEQAQELFSSFRLRISVQPGFTGSPAAEAAVLTLLNAAPRTFLGGVELVGRLGEQCTQAWFNGKALGEVAEKFGVATSVVDQGVPATIHVGEGVRDAGDFWLCIRFTANGFALSPETSANLGRDSSVAVGVAAAGAAINEAFQRMYRAAPLAGNRDIHWRLPALTSAGPPESLWLVGLGHLGQAFLWTLALAANGKGPQPPIRLTDFDDVSPASLSTCLLVQAEDVGRKKVDVVADQLEVLGIGVQRDRSRLVLDRAPINPAEKLAVIAVDNVALRRSLDGLRANRVLEAGIGTGAEGFTRVQLHAFPGKRKARDVWMGDDPSAIRAPDLSKPAYQALLKKTGDQCGTTLLAGRSVATPFVGAFAGAVLAAFSLALPDDGDAWNFDLNCL